MVSAPSAILLGEDFVGSGERNEQTQKHANPGEGIDYVYFAAGCTIVGYAPSTEWR
jgi:hypothetical protein